MAIEGSLYPTVDRCGLILVKKMQAKSRIEAGHMVPVNLAKRASTAAEPRPILMQMHVI